MLNSRRIISMSFIDIVKRSATQACSIQKYVTLHFNVYTNANSDRLIMNVFLAVSNLIFGKA